MKPSFLNPKEKKAAWYLKNKKQIAQKQNEYRKKNHEKIMARQRLRQVLKREEIAAYQKAYRAAHKEKQKSKKLQQKAERIAAYQEKLKLICPFLPSTLNSPPFKLPPSSNGKT